MGGLHPLPRRNQELPHHSKDMLSYTQLKYSEAQYAAQSCFSGPNGGGFS